MTRDQFQELRTLFEEPKSASEEQRSRAIRELEEGDPSLAAELERMLDARWRRSCAATASPRLRLRRNARRRTPWAQAGLRLEADGRIVSGWSATRRLQEPRKPGLLRLLR